MTVGELRDMLSRFRDDEYVFIYDAIRRGMKWGKIITVEDADDAD